jgi:hypothetical protein
MRFRLGFCKKSEFAAQEVSSLVFKRYLRNGKVGKSSFKRGDFIGPYLFHKFSLTSFVIDTKVNKMKFCSYSLIHHYQFLQ